MTVCRVIYSKTGGLMPRFLIFLFLGLLMGCRDKAVVPGLPTDDALYRTWQLTQVFYDGQPVSGDPFPETVTFPRDGSFRGSLPNDSRWCCSPVSFEGTNKAIRFIWDTSSPICAVINCRLSVLAGNVNWQITTLNPAELVLTGERTILVFKAQP
jgi:hypothetical protein